MSVKIRLARRGRKKRPFYHIVVADARAPRDGRFIEKLGSYDPLTKPATIEIDRDRAYEWLMNGAQPTDTARAILRFKGVLYRKHLMRGVQKGALTEEEAMAKYEAWVAEKEAKIKKRFDEARAEKQAFHAAVSGVIPKIKIKEEPVAEEAAEPSADAPAAEAGESVSTEAIVEAKEPEAKVDDVAEKPSAEEPEAKAETNAAAEEKEEPVVAEPAPETKETKEAEENEPAAEAEADAQAETQPEAEPAKEETADEAPEGEPVASTESTETAAEASSSEEE